MIKINPFTRISGFLDINVEVEQGKVINAISSGMLFRGFEQMLKTRNPLDAIYFTERICGICSTAHSMASALALEDAFDVIPALNDARIREFVHGCEFLQNHIRHLYQYTMPDFVKLDNVYPVYETNHQDYRLPEAINKKIAEHYLLSLTYSRLAHKMIATLAGKAPHNHGIFVGGITVNMNISLYEEVKFTLSRIKTFVETILLEDVYTIAEYYPDCFDYGKGYGNLMSYGCFDKTIPQPYVQPGTYIDGVFEDFNPDNITQNIEYAWYISDNPTYTPEGEAPILDRQKEKGYTFIKAPRYKGIPMETGPLARLWLNGTYRKGISTMDRTIARAIETKEIANILTELLAKIELLPASQAVIEIPEMAKGKGLIDTTRGALGHWTSVASKKIDHYTIISPSTWNLSPRDGQDQLGVIEKALIGTPIQDLENPVEIGRTVRSFDPCVSCATHLTGDITLSDIRVI